MIWKRVSGDEGEDDVFEMRGQLRFEEQEKGKMSL